MENSDQKNERKTVLSDKGLILPGEPLSTSVTHESLAKLTNNSSQDADHSEDRKKLIDRFSLAGMLISIGIVFGDIGTSPLYTLSGIVRDAPITTTVALGAVSAIFWTLTFQTTIKYVFITLKADNNGEGGIFALYTLIRKYRKWLVFPAIAGGSFLLADSIITPPISVASAIEGLVPIYPHLSTIPIVIGILVLLFILQRAGTALIGAIFGPVMLIWFSMIAILGLHGLVHHWNVFQALNPIYAYRMLHDYPGGFWLLGGVFLCTTGAEALYSDMGHVGRRNIQFSWIYVKICLVLCYFGQSAWLMDHLGEHLVNRNPFFALAPGWFLIPSIIIATLATIIASQALISGAYTLINEAIRLNLWPRLRVVFPSNERGQLYIPAVNWALMAGCIAVVLYFRESANMEAAYGLSIALTMLMTTCLLAFYLYAVKKARYLVLLLLAVYLTIEGSFLVANLKKFEAGGWMTLLVGSILFMIMYIWRSAINLQKELKRMVELPPFIPVFKELSSDEGVPKYMTNLVYLSDGIIGMTIEEHIINSVFYRQPKRADIYWLVNVEVVDEPYTMRYKVDILAKNDLIYVSFKLGFRIVPRINLFFKMVIDELVKNREIDIENKYNGLLKNNISSDFRFVVIDTFLSVTNDLTYWQNYIMHTYFFLKRYSLSSDKQYGLDHTDTVIEKAPMVISIPRDISLIREW